MNTTKLYLSDSVYADILDGRLVLTTEDGYEVSNTIVLEPEVWDALVSYVKRQNQQEVMEE